MVMVVVVVVVNYGVSEAMTSKRRSMPTGFVVRLALIGVAAAQLEDLA